MCPNCRAFVTTSDRTCPYCGVQLGPRAVERREPAALLGGLIPDVRFTTMMILLINTILFVLEHVNPALALGQNGASVPWLSMDGQWWRLVTAGFLHRDTVHILMNSWVLFDLGAEVEQIYGTSRMIVFYFCSTVTGFLLSSKFGFSNSVGASAGIFGLIGAMLAFGVTDKSALGITVKQLYTRWVIYGVVLSFIPGVDFLAHLGGLSGGFVCGWLASTPRARVTWKEPLLRGLALLCIALTAFSFAMLFLAVAARMA